MQNFACTVSEAQNLQKLTNADGSRQAARNSASLIKTKGKMPEKRKNSERRGYVRIDR